MTLISARDLTVHINAIDIIRSANLDVEANQFVGLLGRNGAGKTTVLRALMGALPTEGGRIIFDGEDISREVPYKRAFRSIGYMPDTCRLIPDLTARENIMLPMTMVGAPDRETTIAWLVNRIPEIDALLSRKASQLSGGQQKLVALARAMSIGKKLLLLDEPIEGVAPSLAMRILDVLISLKKEGWTILTAESNEDHIRGLPDSLYLIERGEIAKAAL